MVASGRRGWPSLLVASKHTWPRLGLVVGPSLLSSSIRSLRGRITRAIRGRRQDGSHRRSVQNHPSIVKDADVLTIIPTFPRSCSLYTRTSCPNVRLYRSGQTGLPNYNVRCQVVLQPSQKHGLEPQRDGGQGQRSNQR